MTRNQISYWEYRERRRSNLVQEKETNRSNLAHEQETKRHNLATESETNRHNLATELLTTAANQETARANQANEQISRDRNAEMSRSNRAQEQIQRDRNDISRAQVSLGYANLAETTAHNRSSERLDLLSLNEARNNHDEINRLTQERQDEMKRANLAAEQQHVLDWTVNVSRNREQSEHNTEAQTEINRSNRVNERLKTIDTISNATEKVSRTADNILKTLGGLQ